jgi:hypothetical protein
METVQERALTVRVIVNILVNTSQVVRVLKKAIEDQMEEFDVLKDSLMNHETSVVQHLDGLETLDAGIY